MSLQRRGVVAPLAVLVALTLTACGPGLPETVVPDTAIAVGWQDAFTSANAVAAPTAGNLAIAQAIRGAFGDVIDGEFVADESFGVVSIVSEEPFTVRYDLAEPVWSDGIPLDAADLLLGWAGAAGYFPPSADSEAKTRAAAPAVTGDPEAAASVPEIDEFARAIEVSFAQPVIGWQQAVTAPVPAHVVGRRALGVDDPMAAKQAVIRAIQDDDRSALGKIGEVWNTGFEVEADGRADVMLSSGPFLIEEVGETADGQSVTLVPNPAFRGAVTPRVARIDLIPPGPTPLAEVGARLDVAVLAPTTADSGLVRELERKDFAVSTSSKQAVWALVLNTAGVFATQPSRAAFLRAVPASDLVERGSGVWSSAYTKTASILVAPGSRAYDVVVEDSGFAQTIGAGSDDPASERQGAGVPADARVCVLYDRTSEFASGAFAALRDAAAEAGWGADDCGSDDLPTALAQGGWDAVIARTPVPRTVSELAAHWGSAGESAITGGADPQRDALIDQYARTTDVYEARELLAEIEASIVQAAVVLPLAADPMVTVVDPRVTGVSARNGEVAGLLAGAAQWEVAR